MSEISRFFLFAAIELGGLFTIYFLLKARLRRFLEIENLLAGVRDEAGALVRELNETADRSVSLVEDRMIALRALLDEVDRRMGVSRREIESREAEREVYAKLSRRRPIVPAGEESARAAPVRAPQPPAAAIQAPADEGAIAGADAPGTPLPITLNLGTESQSGARSGAPRPLPEVRVSENSVIPAATRREEALDLHKRGISADLIAAKLGVTVAEIELLVEMEERRQSGSGGLS
jgi:hypothetical protein